MRYIRFMDKIHKNWQNFTIRKKIVTFTGVVVLMIALSLFFDMLIVKYSMVDFNNILNENQKCNDFVQNMEKESELFEQYVKNPIEENRLLLKEAMQQTGEVVHDLTYDYNQLGEVRFAYTWVILSSYEVYAEHRDAFLNGPEDQENYIENLYDLYEMQKYLKEYGNILLEETITAGGEVYQKKIPAMMALPWIVFIFGILMLVSMLELARTMNRTMKSSAEEYVAALEAKQETLDMLHKEEMQRIEVERQLETMQFEALKNQVKPHFLFNTLNVIGGMAMLENAETTERMIKALSSLLRYNLQNSETETSLKRELKIVRDYMYIQQMRFGERIDYEIDCQVDEERTKVPTFIFQPLVENAVIHGLAKKEEGGKIQIRIREEEDGIGILVEDTGVGMTEEILESVRENLEKEYSHANIGLGNIYRRIRLAYPGSTMDIRSREQQGTTIEIIIRK